ncbi:MAG TPA: alpha-amylase family protein [Sphingobacteriaceae bacterium]
MNHIWYKNAIIYSLDIETFYDSNGDGTGDFQGLIKKLDYLAGLGINCIWLLPFYPSPNRDNGYDVLDYYNVDNRLGTLGDFAEFMDKASGLGIKIIVDLVVNHTSIQHPWFQEARKDAASKYYNYYVWSDRPLDYEDERVMLSGEVDTIWTYDEVAQRYYLHRFYKEQPDLNIANPHVRSEILRIIGFWLRLGVSGFRIDAAEMLIEPYGISGADQEDLSGFLVEMRDFISLRASDGILLAETNLEPAKMSTFMEAGKKMHMVFNFYLNQHLFLALALKSADPLHKALKKLPALEKENQWLNFLRHHDELSLKLLNEKERNAIYTAFAPEDNMKIFGSGIRRRLAPMLNGDQQRLELSYSLLFTLPGICMIRYGDELGMGEDLRLEGRSSVRTPMQWNSSIHAGFSSSEENYTHPVISDGHYSFKHVNVAASQGKPGSLLNWIEHLITTRRQFPGIGLGIPETFQGAHPAVFVHSFRYDDEQVWFLHNLGDERVVVELTWSGLREKELVQLLGDEPLNKIGKTIVMNPYGYRWMRAV